MTSSAQPDLVTGPLARRTFRFGLPLGLGMAAHGLFNCVDLVIVGRLGEGAIAAVTVGGIITMIAMLMFNGFTNVVAALVSRFVGAGQQARACVVALESFWLAIAASIILGLLFYLPASWLVSLVRMDAGTQAEGTGYLEIMALGSGTMFLILQGTAVLRASGRTFWPVTVLVGANIVNLVLDFLLVFGLGGFPKMGVAGAAWATVIARGLGALVLVVVLVRGVGPLRLFSDGVLPKFRYWRTIMGKGLSSSLQLIVRVASMYLLLAIATDPATTQAGVQGGRDVLDGLGICIRLEMVVIFFGLGWGGAAGVVVGQNLGNGRPDRALKGTWLIFAWCAGLVVLASPLFFLAARSIFQLIAPDLAQVAYDAGATYFQYTVPFYVLLLVGVIGSQALNGAGSTGTPLVIDTFSYLLLMLLLASKLAGTSLGIQGCWIALVVAHGLSSVLYVAVAASGRWKHRSLVKS